MHIYICIYIYIYLYVCMYVFMCICRRVRQRDAKSHYLTPLKGMQFLCFGPQRSHLKEAICPSIWVFFRQSLPKKRVKQRGPTRTKITLKTTRNVSAISVPLCLWGASCCLTRACGAQNPNISKRHIPPKPLFWQCFLPPPLPFFHFVHWNHVH